MILIGDAAYIFKDSRDVEELYDRPGFGSH